MAEALSIQSLKKVYSNKVVALRGIDLKVDQGDFFGLLGPNGAGKSTIIGIITGLVNKTSGTVKVFGVNIDDHPEGAKSYIGVVPQEFNFNIFEKVIDIVVNQAGYYGIPRVQAARDAEVYLRQLGLWDKRNDPARTLSGGLKRRLMIARALIHHPKLLILDEPTAGVDIELRRSMWDFLRTLTEQGITIILTTHYLEEAEQLCKHLAIIDKGQIIEYGTIKEILSKLSVETFVFDLKHEIPDGVLSLINHFNIKRVDPTTIEMNLTKDDTLNAAILELNRHNIYVKSMRNKANRLEELFVNLTKGAV
ncbi:MAG: ABC transporter ATP-binding protein [Ignavibacteriales bacterium]